MNYKNYNADFTKYFDKGQRRNIWVLGYFGGGPVNIVEAMQVAKDYADATGAPLNTVVIDEILSSSRYKGFKFVYSQYEQTPEKGSTQLNNVYAMLRD